MRTPWFLAGLVVLLMVPSATACLWIPQAEVAWTPAGIVYKAASDEPAPSGTLAPTAVRFVDDPGPDALATVVQYVPCGPYHQPGFVGVPAARPVTAYMEAHGWNDNLFEPPGDPIPAVYLQSPQGHYAYFYGEDAQASWSGFAFRGQDGAIRFGQWDELADPRREAGPGRLVMADDSLWLVAGQERRALELAAGTWRDLPPLEGLPEPWYPGEASGRAVVFRGTYGAPFHIADETGIVAQVPAGQYYPVAQGWFVDLQTFDEYTVKTATVTHNGHVVPGPTYPASSLLFTSDPDGRAYTLWNGDLASVTSNRAPAWVGAVPLAVVGLATLLRRQP